jgi:hypothetical protein
MNKIGLFLGGVALLYLVLRWFKANTPYKEVVNFETKVVYTRNPVAVFFAVLVALGGVAMVFLAFVPKL